jgi:hypothetical protein
MDICGLLFLGLDFFRTEPGAFGRFGAVRRFTDGGVWCDAAMRRMKREELPQNI